MTDNVQLPGQQVGSVKETVGVVDATLSSDDDVLARQAVHMARARIARGQEAIAYEGGGEMPDEFYQKVGNSRFNSNRYDVNQMRSVTADTITALTNGSIARDQQYIGNNADWTGYYLEPLAKFVVPFDTPVRNMLPRNPSVGIDEENWRAITSVFGGNGPQLSNFVLAQWNPTTTAAPQQAQYTWVSKKNILRMLSFSDAITFESELYGRMFEPDVRAKIAAKLAPSLMVGQEMAYINGAQYLWAPPVPNNISTATTGGNLAANTYYFVVTAVNANGETLAFGGSTPTVSSMVVPAGTSTNTISFNIQRVPGATSYNVYMGTAATNAGMKVQAATLFGGASALNDPGGLSAGYFTVTMTGALATGSATYATTVAAGNTAVSFTSGSSGTPANQILMFDGLQSLIYLNTGSLSTYGEGGETAVVKSVAASNGALAAGDINNLLESMYYNSHANPECLLVSVKDHKALSNVVTTSTAYRVVTNPTQAGLSDLVGGARATKWINQTTGRLMDIIMCPYLMQGTIIACSLSLPFPVAEIDKPPLRISYNRDMWAQEYPPDQSHQTRWAYSVFSNETMICQYLGGQGVLNGIVTA